MLKKVTRKERIQQIEKEGYDKISKEDLRDSLQRPQIRDVLRDRRLRFLGHNLRNIEPVTSKQMAEELVSIKPGKWAKQAREDVNWLIEKMKTNGNLKSL